MNLKRKNVLGIDIGISSCGWGILDVNTGEIISAGVRLFGEGTSELNEKRRGYRGGRRLLRRRKHRLERLERFLVNEDIISKEDITKNLEKLSHINPYEIRVKGVKEKLSKKELFIALKNIARHRGSDNIKIIEDEKSEEGKEQKGTKDILKKNSKLLEGKFVCELQLDRFNDKTKTVRGIDNKFETSDYIKELKQILSFYNLTEQQEEKICEIVENRRAYYDGPGSETSPTPYGQWFYDENGKLVHVGMIEKMRGKCSIYPDEYRAPKMSYTAHLFNLLNELNNLRYGDNQKITSKQKKKILEENIHKKDSITPIQLAKFIGLSVEEIKGFPIKKDEKPFLSAFDGVKKIRKALEGSKNLNEILENKGLLDKIAQILTDHKSLEKRVELFKKDNLKEDDINKIAEIGGFSGYHSLSLKAMREMLDDLQNTSDNQMQIIWKSGMGKDSAEKLEGLKNIPFSEDKVFSPVAIRAEREAIKVINAVRKKYGEMDSIVIEMPRDKNSKDEQKRIRESQKKYSQEIKKTEEILSKEGESVRSIPGKTKLKIRLYNEQNCKCAYSGESIDLSELINDETAYEIDHIIPLSISFDDSLANKVLCKSSENQKKGQQTPWAYFKSGRAGRSYEDFKKQVLATKFKRKKREYLLLEEDVSKYENQKKFINRNLVDTRYASRALLNMVQNYMRANNIDTKVHTIRGSVTSGFRKRAGIKKDRDEDYSHHAIDALIVAGIKKMKFMDNALLRSVVSESQSDGEKVLIDTTTGEILTQKDINYFDESYIRFIKNLDDDIKNKIKYSHKVDKKPNRKISNETIYGIREIEGEEIIIGKYSNIYENDGEKVAKLFRELDKKSGELKANKLLMYKNDLVTFNLLKDICESYKSEKNPFSAYFIDNGDYIRKCDKKDGPIIKSLRYHGDKLGTHQDITHKYQKGNKVVKLSINPYRVDFYKDFDNNYKFLRVIYSDIKSTKNGYDIDEKKYKAEKERRGIDDKYKFQFSLYKGDIFGYIQKGEEEKEEIFKYNGTNYNSNKIEYKHIDKKIFTNEQRTVEKREMISIGKKTKLISKYSSDVLGNIFKVQQNEICKMKIDMIQ